MSSRIWLSKPHLTNNEIQYIEKALFSNWITTSGENIDLFEREISEYLGKKDSVITLNSGTSAIHLALVNLDIGFGDEVLCSSFSFCASANPIMYQKATPVFIDSEEDTWNMSPYFLEAAIKDRIKKKKKPKAMIIADTYGMPAKWNELIRISNRFEIPIIQDSAAAMGSKYGNQMCGLMGDYGVFSFNGNKIITTSSGGALILNKNQDINDIILIASQSKISKTDYIYNKVGYNYRMSNILASIGRSQLLELNNRILKRREINLKYKNELKSNLIEFLEEPSEKFYSNFWLSCVLFNLKEIKLNIEEIISIFNDRNIEVRRLWKPLHLQKIYKNSLFFGSDVSIDLYERGLCIPSSSNLKNVEQAKVINVFKRNILK